MLGTLQALFLSQALFMALIAVSPDEAPNLVSRRSVSTAVGAAVFLFVGLVI